MNRVEILHEIILLRKSEARGILSHTYSEEEVRKLCRYFLANEPEKLRKNNDDVTFFSTVALLRLMELEDFFYLKEKKTSSDDERVADLILKAMEAMGCLVEAGWKPSEPFAIKGKQFTDGPKKSRIDVLGKIMLQVFNDFVSQNDRDPTAQELWDALPDNEIIQEKDSLMGVTQEDKTKQIWWRTPSGKEKRTTFKSFQSRLTLIKKKK